MSDVADVIKWAVIGIVTIIFAYALVRSMSFAYFRTKLAYLRAAMKEMTKGDGNG